QLEAARGPEFDRLFLTFMIQHHRGAVQMVEELLAQRGAANDETVFKFAADVNVDQTTEINRMLQMLLVAPCARPAFQFVPTRSCNEGLIPHTDPIHRRSRARRGGSLRRDQ